MHRPQVLAFFVLVLALPRPARTQEVNPFGCQPGPSVSATLSSVDVFNFDEVAGLPPEWTASRRAARTLGPFDEATYGFHSLRIWARLTPRPDDDSRAAIEVFAERLGTSTTTIWKLSDTTERAPGHGPLWITDQSGGGANIEMPFRPTLPIIRVRHLWGTRGMNTSWPHVTQFLLDFRRPHPRVLALMECSMPDGGGACTAYDYGFEQGQGAICQWDDDKQDVRCDFTRYFPLPWGSRVEHTLAYLEKQEKPVLPDHVAAQPAELGDLVPLLKAGAPFDGLVRDMGHVRELFSFSQRPGAPPVHILAAASPESSFDVRLFLVDGIAVREIRETLDGYAAGPVGPNRTTAADWVELERLDYSVKQIYKAGQLRIIQVVATAAAQQRTAYGLFWIGLEQVGKALFAEKFTVAVDGPSYDHCNQFERSATAVSVSFRKPGFRAELDVEPEWVENVYPPVTERPCPVIEIVSWRRGEGFVVDDRERPCDHSRPARVPIINDDGTVTAREFRDER